MKKINSAAASYYYPNGISDDQADTYIDTDSNENNAGAGIKPPIQFYRNMLY